MFDDSYYVIFMKFYICSFGSYKSFPIPPCIAITPVKYKQLLYEYGVL